MEGNKSRRQNSDRREKINVFNPKMLRYGDLWMENIENIVHFLFSFLSSFFRLSLHVFLSDNDNRKNNDND